MQLSVIADFLEEDWPSMDLAADMLVAESRLAGVPCRLVRPKLWDISRARPLPASAGRRAIGRFVQYPIALSAVPRAGAFHVADHSYAHLVHCLPAGRTGIYCHDLDAFRSLLEPSQTGVVRRGLSTLLLSGMRRAAVVFHSTQVVREEILAHQLVHPDRLIHAPLGASPEFVPDRDFEDRGVIEQHSSPYLLHVGSCVPRKNVGFLLRVFSELRNRGLALRLVRVGGAWSSEARAALRSLGLESSTVQLHGVPRRQLAALYRQAAAVVIPSTAEGFGLPMIEALACGALVVASDLPVLREVGGDAAVYCAVNELTAWVGALDSALKTGGPGRVVRAARAARFSWAEHARVIVDSYRLLLQPNWQSTV